jgi:hypothetical protein
VWERREKSRHVYGKALSSSIGKRQEIKDKIEPFFLLVWIFPAVIDSLIPNFYIPLEETREHRGLSLLEQLIFI